MTQTMLAIAGLGTPELIVIVLVIFLLFGATRLPQLAKALGQSKKAFREGIEEGEREPPRKEVKEQRSPRQRPALNPRHHFSECEPLVQRLESPLPKARTRPHASLR